MLLILFICFLNPYCCNYCCNCYHNNDCSYISPNKTIDVALIPAIIKPTSPLDIIPIPTLISYSYLRNISEGNPQQASS
jgi:hypothetical protein